MFNSSAAYDIGLYSFRFSLFVRAWDLYAFKDTFSGSGLDDFQELAACAAATSDIINDGGAGELRAWLDDCAETATDQDREAIAELLHGLEIIAGTGKDD